MKTYLNISRKQNLGEFSLVAKENAKSEFFQNVSRQLFYHHLHHDIYWRSVMLMACLNIVSCFSSGVSWN